jgi:hypothetical protein
MWADASRLLHVAVDFGQAAAAGRFIGVNSMVQVSQAGAMMSRDANHKYNHKCN